MKVRPRLAMFACAVLAGTVLTVMGQSAVAVDGSATISGTVTLAGVPVPGASVLVTSTDMGTHSATTGVDGTYEAAGLAPGAYVIRVRDSLKQAPFYLATFHGDTVRRPDATAVTVAAGATQTGVDIAAAPDAGVTGRLLSSSGEPFGNTSEWSETPGVAVTNDRRTGEGHALLDGDSRFVVHGLASGPATVRGVWDDAERAVHATLVAGRVIDVGDIRLPGAEPRGPGKIIGRASANQGKLHAYDIVAVDTDGEGHQPAKLVGKKHRFTIGGLHPGTYRVGFSGGAVLATVKVRKDDPVSVGKLVRRRAQTLRGVVRNAKGKPLVHAMVEIETLGSSWGTGTNRKGRYKFNGLQPGTYRVTVAPLGGSLAPVRTKVRVPVSHAGTKNFRLTKGRTITVRVKSATGSPVEGMRVTTRSVTGQTVSATTNRNGRAVLRHLDAHVRHLQIVDKYVGGYLSKTVKVGKSTKKTSVTVKTGA